jgi:RND family efflux transporter MFP subunit
MNLAIAQNVVASPERSGAETDSRRRAGPRLLMIGVLIVALLAGALTLGTLPRLWQQRRLDDGATQAASQPPRVSVAIAKRIAPTAERILPGNSLPLMEAALFARATGYVSKRLVDIGDVVEAGQLLAEISAPDIDDQLEQAKANLELSRANLVNAQANSKLAQQTLKREQGLVRTDSVSAQELETAQATAESTAAQVASSLASIHVNEATVKQFADLQSFQKITAPFPGVITARHVETGDLITADSTARELFHLMRTDILRVFVNVPQTFAAGVNIGQSAAVYRREDPEKQYAGKVTRTSDALDPNTRTLLTQVDVPNPNNTLRPGMYLQVKFDFNRKIYPLMIPAAALATRTQGQRVAVLDAEQRVHYRDVRLGRDYGAEIQVLAGLTEGEQVVVHPGDDLPEGTVVEPIPLPTR